MAFGDTMRVEVTTVKSAEQDRYDNGGFTITGEHGWTFGVSAKESGTFVPKAGDTLILAQVGNYVSGIIIEGHVFRWKSVDDIKEEHEQWKKNYRLEKLERYVEHGDALKARAAALPAPLAARMQRFGDEDGIEFWIDSAPYEMAVMDGAAALLRKVQELGYIADVDNPTDEGNDVVGAVEWINDWWALNTKEHNYDYKKQMEIVPDFGEGHSGNTAGAAYVMSKFVLQGEDI